MKRAATFMLWIATSSPNVTVFAQRDALVPGPAYESSPNETPQQGIRVESTRAMVAALRRAGGSPRYTEYPGVGHNAWIDGYQDPELHRWLFDQRRD